MGLVCPEDGLMGTAQTTSVLQMRDTQRKLLYPEAPNAARQWLGCLSINMQWMKLLFSGEVFVLKKT